MKRCAIIGGGLAGLSAALYLSKDSSCHIDCYEKNLDFGGKAGTISADGFRFDTGPTLVTMSFIIDELFGYLDKDRRDYLSFVPLEINCDYFYPDGTRFTAFTDQEKYIGEAARVFGITEKSVSGYLLYTKNIYDLVKDLFLFNSFHEIDSFKSIRLEDAGKYISGIDSFRSMHQANKSFFDNSRMVQYCDRYATFNGSNPYKTPATLNVIHHVEQLGAVVPKGGIAAIPKALTELCKNQKINLFPGKKVDRILARKNRVHGIAVENRNIEYDVVVSNCDVRTTYEHLLRKRWLPGAVKYRFAEPSSSALVFYWGLGITTRLATHSILFSDNYKQEFRDLFSRFRIPDDPTVYIYISGRFAAQDAPKGCENWYVMVNAPRCKSQNWHNEIQRTRQRIIAKIQKHFGFDIQKYLKTEKIMAPPDIMRDTGSWQGSLYGPSSNGMMAAFLRQGNRSRAIKNLYFAGGSAHPGGGIPLSILSGKITAGLVRKYSL
ncbi:MAG: phytoene desaturase [Spirochaetales bacterium]|nr:phytoene desaturase [Spirochaetales bacterium]